MAYTKGPWRLAGLVGVMSEEGKPVCITVCEDSAESVANLRLIAAAPAMFAALTMALDALRAISEEGVDKDTFNEGGIGHDAVLSALAALQKAHGME